MGFMRRVLSNRLFIVLTVMASLCLFLSPSVKGVIQCLFAFPFFYFFAENDKIWEKKITAIQLVLASFVVIVVLKSGVRYFISTWMPSSLIGNISGYLGLSKSAFLHIVSIAGCAVGFWSVFQISNALISFLWQCCQHIVSGIKAYCANNSLKAFPFKSLLMAFLSVAVSAVVATALLCAVFTIKTDSIELNVEKSAERIANEGTYPHVFSWCHSQLDNYTDAIMLLESANQNDQNIISKAMLSFRGTIRGDDPYETLIDHYCRGVAFDGTTTYGRYWHGYQIVLRPLLSIMDYSVIRILNLCVQIGLTGLIVFLLYRKNMKNVIIPYCIIYLMLAPVILGKSIQFSSCFYIMSIGVIGVILAKDSKRAGIIPALFLFLGIMTAFFDFLTYPVITFGVPVSLYMATRNEKGKRYICIVRSFVAWLTGYAGMWASKWIISTLTTEKNVISNALATIQKRTSNYSPSGERYLLADVLKKNLSAFIYTPFTIFFVLFIIYCIVKAKRRLRKDINLADLLGPYIVIALIPFVWYGFAINHSAIHYWFTNKACAVTLFAVLMGINTILESGKVEKHG